MLGGVVAFVWSSIAHMMPFTGHLGLSTMNEKAEDAVMAAMKSNLQQPGLYFFPGMDLTKEMTKEVVLQFRQESLQNVKKNRSQNQIQHTNLIDWVSKAALQKSEDIKPLILRC